MKTGATVLVSVRRAFTGTSLDQLRDRVSQEFLTLDESEQRARKVLARLESGFLQRLAAVQHE